MLGSDAVGDGDGRRRPEPTTRFERGADVASGLPIADADHRASRAVLRLRVEIGLHERRFAVSSAMTTSSVGPAVMSMPTVPTSRALAAVTYDCPGRRSCRRARSDSVPSASAAMPAAPPQR